jgi:hypothetical protein
VTAREKALERDKVARLRLGLGDRAGRVSCKSDPYQDANAGSPPLGDPVPVADTALPAETLWRTLLPVNLATREGVAAMNRLRAHISEFSTIDLDEHLEMVARVTVHAKRAV